MSKIINGVASEYDIPPNEKMVNGYYQTNIKTSRNKDNVYAMKYASQQMLIDNLKQIIDKMILNKEEMELLKYVFSVAYDNCFSSEIEEIGKLETKLLEILGGENNR